MKKKIIILSLSIIVIGILLYIFGPYLYYQAVNYYQAWQIKQKAEKFEQAYLDFLKNDTYGGKTPQETYELYVEALKKGDIDLAVKYYWWEKQVAEKERLEKLKAEGKLQEYVDSLPKWEEMTEEEYWDPNGAMYVKTKIYTEPHMVKLPTPDFEGKTELIVPPGEEVVFSVNFQLNKYSNIWKLY